MRVKGFVFTSVFIMMASFAAHPMSISDMREWLMKTSGFAMLDLKKIADDKAPFDQNKISAALNAIRQATLDIPKAFPKGSENITATASSDIWENPEDFDQKLKELVADIDAALKDPPNDRAAVGTLFRTLSADCQSCHKLYRID